jgi:hypothetical protein
MQQRQLESSSRLSVSAGLPFDANRLNGGSSKNNKAGFISVESPTSKNSENDSKVGVLLLNLGGPEKTEDVEGKNDVRLRDVFEWCIMHSSSFSHIFFGFQFLQVSCIIYLPIQISSDYLVHSLRCKP